MRALRTNPIVYFGEAIDLKRLSRLQILLEREVSRDKEDIDGPNILIVEEMCRIFDGYGYEFDYGLCSYYVDQLHE